MFILEYYTNFTEFWDSKKGIIAPLDLTPLTGLTSFDNKKRKAFLIIKLKALLLI